MSLNDYRKKRKFTKTPEPKGTKKQTTGPLMFVIQKHQASRLHYDFRLELDGVLKSWAVPKGPSLNPDDKRLAVMVEDHPLDYASFEGIIPKGQYGGGTVMVWDRGVYSPIALVDRKKAEALLTEQLKKGHLTFFLLGEKLKGEFALVKTHGKGEDSWLLIKAGDEYASDKDILREDYSVITNRTLDEIKKQSGAKDTWFSKPKSLQMQNLHKGDMPHHIKPMLAQTSDEPFDDEQWLFEMKYDGYRAIAEKKGNAISLYSRNGISYHEKFSHIVSSLRKFPGDVVLDGEVAVVDKDGRPHFQWIQDYPDKKHGELVYFVFDVLYYDGYTLVSEPLIRRKELLREILPPLPGIVYSDFIEGTGITMFQQVKHLGIEGIIAKHKDSHYQVGKRSTDWLKIKTEKREEVIIAGFTAPRGGRKHFGSLIMGMYKDDKLEYIGHVGGGFDDKKLRMIYEMLQPLISDRCPFGTAPETNAPVTWVKPKILAEVTFSEWTRDGQMRHPIFLGLREDKEIKDVKEERYFSKDTINKKNKSIIIGKQKLILTNLSKVFWPKDNYTKGNLIDYYQEIAPILLPYLKNRPESLLRYPNGITGKSFYQKDAGLLDVDWLETVSIHSDSNNKDIPYLLCQDKATLIYLINLGCIDLNPWNSRIGKLDYPDYLLIDLDPEETSFSHVVEVALTTRDVLEDLDIQSYVKTSGAKGMHIYIPLGAKYTYEQTRNLAELLCIQIHHKIPAITSLKRSPKDRKGLVYLDYLQNREGQTLASVYSVRPQPGAPVSMPLHWSEVTKSLHPLLFTIENAMRRIQKHGDIFKEVLGKGIEMEKVLNRMSK
jgi:bifunctional non-homologous end joining protein LigD